MYCIYILKQIIILHFASRKCWVTGKGSFVYVLAGGRKVSTIGLNILKILSQTYTAF